LKNKLFLIYRKLYAYFGPQHWWPADTPFEVAVGAILTQNTNWQNVSRAIGNLKEACVLTPNKLYHLPQKKLARLIRPSGYFNIKAKRLKEFLRFLYKSHKNNLNRMSKVDTLKLRRQLLSVNGIGPETADSILLYALNKPMFVIDAYTKRILYRHRLISKKASYDDAQNLFLKNLKNDIRLFNEYHALFVRLGKEFCLKREPHCENCPLK
jgi:endonuclease-3 related protein